MWLNAYILLYAIREKSKKLEFRIEKMKFIKTQNHFRFG
jgi:hypothetical protein